MFATNTQNAVLTIRIDRPDKRNALTLAMREEFAALLLDADGRDDVAAVVLTGTDPAFSAGVDLGEFGSNIMTAHDRRYRVNPTRAIFALRKPIVAAVNGACVSGGLEIALACDFIVASDRATFADSHASIGAMPSWGLTALSSRGRRSFGEADLVDGCPLRRAAPARLRLGQRGGRPRRARIRVATIAAAMVAADSNSVRQILDLYDRGDGASLAEALAFEADVIADRVADASKVQQRGVGLSLGRRLIGRCSVELDDEPRRTERLDMVGFAGRDVEVFARPKLDAGRWIGFEDESHVAGAHAEPAPHSRRDGVCGEQRRRHGRRVELGHGPGQHEIGGHLPGASHRCATRPARYRRTGARARS